MQCVTVFLSCCDILYLELLYITLAVAMLNVALCFYIYQNASLEASP